MENLQTIFEESETETPVGKKTLTFKNDLTCESVRVSMHDIKKLQMKLENIGEECSILSKLLSHIILKCEGVTSKIESLERKP